MYSEAAEFEDVLADGRGVNLLLPAASSIIGSTLANLGAAGVEPLSRPGSVLGDEVGDDVQPLSVPGEHATPHLESTVCGNLALEAALDGAEHDADGALDRGARLRVQDDLSLRVAREGRHGGTAEVRDEVGSRDIEVGEVGRVGLVQVVVDLEDGRVRGSDDGLEERIGAVLRGLAQRHVVENGVEDAILAGC